MTKHQHPRGSQSLSASLPSSPSVSRLEVQSTLLPHHTVGHESLPQCSKIFSTIDQNELFFLKLLFPGIWSQQHKAYCFQSIKLYGGTFILIENIFLYNILITVHPPKILSDSPVLLTQFHAFSPLSFFSLSLFVKKKKQPNKNQINQNKKQRESTRNSQNQ